jgi:hypothetical protein
LTSLTASAAASSASVTLDAHPSHIMPSTFREISKGSSEPFEARIVYLEAAGAAVFARELPALRSETGTGCSDQFPARRARGGAGVGASAAEGGRTSRDDAPDGHELDPGEREKGERERHRGARVCVASKRRFELYFACENALLD